MPSLTNQAMRLDRLLTMLAIGTRTQVKDIIRSGRVQVNGKATRSADFHVEKDSEIRLNGEILDARTSRLIMLNKPCGVLTAARDPKQPTVLDLLPPLYASCGCMPVGRLDKDTEGLLILSTDGELAHRLLSPRRHVWKCYQATVNGSLSESHVRSFEQGLKLSDFDALPAKLQILSSSVSSATALVYVCEGKFHQVRRMFEACGRTVTTLKRLSVGPLKLDESLAPGTFRDLTNEEIGALWEAVSGEPFHE